MLHLSGCGGAGVYADTDAGGRFVTDAGSLSSQCFGSNDCPTGQMCNEFSFCVPIQSSPGSVDAGGPPPEVVVRVEAPASGKRFVYVAVPDQDTVVKIDSVGLQVETLAVGHNPGQLRTVPGQDVALVLNRGSSTVTVLRTNPDGSDNLITLPTAPGLNNLAMSPDGQNAIAFFDLSLSGGNLAPQQTFQSATLIKLAAGNDQSFDLSVGFQPTSIQFSQDSATGFVITQQGVSIVQFAAITKAAIVPTVSLQKDPLVEMIPTQVQVTGDGKWALAHLPGYAGVRVADLATATLSDLPLAGEPSDIELTPDGTVAVFVLREQSQIAIADLPGDLTNPGDIQTLSSAGYVAGQAVVTSDGAYAFIFTNAIDQKALLLADLKARTVSVHLLQKGVRNILAAPNGKSAIIIHDKAPGTPSPLDPIGQDLDEHEAYSLFDVQSGYVKLQLTGTAPGDAAFAPDSSSAYLLLDDPKDGITSVEAIDLGSFIVTDVPLGSPPIAVGVVPATAQVYVAQDNSLGRMTFVDTTSFLTRTLTGFGLNSQIIQ